MRLLGYFVRLFVWLFGLPLGEVVGFNQTTKQQNKRYKTSKPYKRSDLKTSKPHLVLLYLLDHYTYLCYQKTGE